MNRNLRLAAGRAALRGVVPFAFLLLISAGCADQRAPTTPTPLTPTGTGTPAGTSATALRGTVTDATGLPLAGATVEWTGAAEFWGDRGHGVTTDRNGEYRIAIGAPPPGGYALARASKTGYDTQTKSVVITGDTLLNFAVGRFSANGSVTLVSAGRAQPLCPEIAAEVGKTYPLWLIMKSEATSVTLTLSHDEPPSDDLFVTGSSVFSGTRSGAEIAATYSGPGDSSTPFGCSTDKSFTYGAGGALNATVSGNHLSGQYTEIKGSGAAQVTFVFQFQASF